MLALAAALLAQGPASSETPAGPLEAAPAVGFVHVEANVDAAAGGHAGLRIGSHVYHFLQTGEGTLELTRVDWPGFRYVYAGLKNRDLFVYTLDLEPDDARRVASSAACSWIEQRLARERVERLAADAAWWRALRDGTPTPPLAGLGLLAQDGADECEAGRALREALRERWGADFAVRRLAWLDQAIADALRAEPSLEGLRERCTEREVVRAIRRAAPLDPAALVDDRDGRPLDAAERRSLELCLDDLRASVVALWDSPRPDRGRALAVSVARHHAVARSLAEGRLWLLDAFADDARVVRPDAEEALLAYAPLFARTRAGLASLRAAILDGGRPTQQELARLEEAATRSREARRGARGEAVRLATGRLLPARGRSVAPLATAAAALPAPTLELVAARAEAAWHAARASYRERFAYGLLRHNCATELVRLLNGAFADEDEARRALGACLAPGKGFAFVPWVLARQVRSGLRLRELEVVRSHLRTATDALTRGQAGLWSRWREASALTSAVYAPRAADGWFLLFTDETVWNRPLLGALNLGYGVLRGALGVLTLPFDGGENARAGLHGAFFSLPELAFGNVRKGTFAFVDPEPALASSPAVQELP